jgi:RNase P protein component
MVFLPIMPEKAIQRNRIKRSNTIASRNNILPAMTAK